MCDTDDLGQQAWIILHGAADRYDPERKGFAGKPTKFTTYAYREIKRGLCRYVERSAKTVPRDGVVVASGLIDTRPSMSAEDKEVVRLASHAIQNLRPLDRQIVHSRLIEGMSFKEVGDRLGRNMLSVFKRYHRAMDKVRNESLRSCRVQAVLCEVRSQRQEGGHATGRRDRSRSP